MPIVLFFLNPFLSLLYAFLMNIKTNKKIFYAFVILFSLYFGYSLTPQNTALDSFQIIRLFESWDSIFPSYSDFLREWIKFDNHFAKDLYEGTIFFFVRIFTNNYHFIFLICALVFSVFKLKSFDYFLRDYTYNRLHIILAIFFFISIPLFEINGIRFFTASWIAIYATLKIFVDSNKRYLCLLAITPLVHITFLFYLLIIAIAYVAVRRVNSKILIAFFITSIFIGLAWDTLPKIGSVGDSVLGNLLDAYINDDYKTQIDTAVAQSNFVRIFNPLRYLYYNATVMMLYLNLKDKPNKYIVIILIVLLSITNCVGFIPSMSRFFNILTPLILIVLNQNFSITKSLRVLVYILPIVEAFRVYQIYFTLYPDVLPDGFLINIILT